MSRTFIPEPDLPTEAETAEFDTSPQEFEFVLGRRQIASVSLLVLALLALFTVASYMVGKSSAQSVSNQSVLKTVTVEVPVKAAPVPAPPPVVSTPAPAIAALPDAPLAGSPEKGKLYIQLGHLERGFATLMVLGARNLGFPAFISPNGSETAYRVLSGPYESGPEYERAKTAFAAMGLNTFVRRYTEDAPVNPTPDQP